MHSPSQATELTTMLGIRHPIIGGAMYPCSNPELVAAVSSAGGIGVLQPVSLVYVHGLDFREGIRHIRSLTDGPIGMNVLTEKSSDRYLERMQQWLSIAIEEGVAARARSGVVIPTQSARPSGSWARCARNPG